MAKQKPDKKKDPDSAMTVLEHLAELRTRVMRAVLVLLALFLLCYAFSGKLLLLLGRPLEQALQTAELEHQAKLKAETESSAASKQGETDGNGAAISGTVGAGTLDQKQQFTCSCVPETGQTHTARPESELSRLLIPKAAGSPEQKAAGAGHQADQQKIEAGKAPPGRPLSGEPQNGPTNLPPNSATSSAISLSPTQDPKPSSSSQAPDLTPNLNSSSSATPAAKLNPSRLSCYCEKVAASPQPEKKQSLFVFLGLTEVFFSEIKISFWLALFFAVPYLFVEIWGFVAPAMYKKEKKLVFWLFVGTFVCFIGGSLFSYFVVFPLGFHFFLSMASFDLATPNLSIAQYLDFALVLIFMFGVVFELPMVCIALALLDLISAPAMIRQSRIAVLIIFVISGIITPPDPLSMILMALPLTGLYFISYLLVGLLKGFRPPKAGLA